MGTRLTEAERVLEALRLGDGQLDVSRRPPGAPEHALRVAMAAVAWLWVVFGLCYVAIPAVVWQITGDPGGLSAAPGFALAFVAASVMTGLGVLLARPTITRGRVWAATLGGLTAWALATQVGDAFLPLTGMPAATLGILLVQNLFEMSLLGAMWASFARKPGTAFALGALFQLFILGIAGILL